MTNIHARNRVAQHYCELNGVTEEERVALIASLYHCSERMVLEVVTARAVCEYLHALGITHEPALEVLIAAARKFHIPTEALQLAVDEHLLSVEAS